MWCKRCAYTEELIASSLTLPPPPPTDPTVREAALRIGRMSICTADDKGKAGKPSDYDGSTPQFCAWWREVCIYIQAKKIMDNEDKILTVFHRPKSRCRAYSFAGTISVLKSSLVQFFALSDMQPGLQPVPVHSNFKKTGPRPGWTGCLSHFCATEPVSTGCNQFSW
jgi:hypothetical protein